MTEKEVLAKLSEFKEVIISLKEENKSLKSTIQKKDEEISDFHSGMENSVKALAECAKKSDGDDKKIEELEERNKELEGEFEKFKQQKVYTEDDLKELLKKAASKSKEKIKSLNDRIASYENEVSELQQKCSNLEIANKGLERKQSNVIYPAEVQLEEMIDESRKRDIIGV